MEESRRRAMCLNRLADKKLQRDNEHIERGRRGSIQNIHAEKHDLTQQLKEFQTNHSSKSLDYPPSTNTKHRKSVSRQRRCLSESDSVIPTIVAPISYNMPSSNAASQRVRASTHVLPIVASAEGQLGSQLTGSCSNADTSVSDSRGSNEIVDVGRPTPCIITYPPVSDSPSFSSRHSVTTPGLSRSWHGIDPKRVYDESVLEIELMRLMARRRRRSSDVKVKSRSQITREAKMAVDANLAQVVVEARTRLMKYKPKSSTEDFAETREAKPKRKHRGNTTDASSSLGKSGHSYKEFHDLDALRSLGNASTRSSTHLPPLTAFLQFPKSTYVAKREGRSEMKMPPLRRSATEMLLRDVPLVKLSKQAPRNYTTEDMPNYRECKRYINTVATTMKSSHFVNDVKTECNSNHDDVTSPSSTQVVCNQSIKTSSKAKERWRQLKVKLGLNKDTRKEESALIVQHRLKQLVSRLATNREAMMDSQYDTLRAALEERQYDQWKREIKECRYLRTSVPEFIEDDCY